MPTPDDPEEMSWFEEMLEDNVCWTCTLLVLFVCGSMWIDALIR